MRKLDIKCGIDVAECAEGEFGQESLLMLPGTVLAVKNLALRESGVGVECESSVVPFLPEKHGLRGYTESESMERIADACSSIT